MCFVCLFYTTINVLKKLSAKILIMDPETARKRRERAKQRALLREMRISSNPEAKHLSNENERKCVEMQVETQPSDTLRKTVDIKPESNDEIIENQNISTEKKSPNSQSDEIKANTNKKENVIIKEVIDDKGKEENIEIKDNVNIEENDENKRNEENKNEEDTRNRENAKIEEDAKNVKNDEIKAHDSYTLENEQTSLSSPYCNLKNQDYNTDSNIPELIPADSKSSNIFSFIFTIRSIPFILAPIFSYFSIPFSFLILALMDIILFCLAHPEMAEKFEQNFFSIFKYAYEYVQQFSLRVTILECIIIVLRIFLQNQYL